MAIKRYSIPQIGLHWWMALLFGANYIVSEGMGEFLDKHLDGMDTSNDWVAQFHVYVGLFFLVSLVIRLLLRLFQKAPEAAASSNPRLDQIAVYTHRLLYLLMFLVPLAGMLAWFGKIDQFGDIHVILMNCLLALIGLHVVGAIYHQFVLKDGLMTRMSPLGTNKK